VIVDQPERAASCRTLDQVLAVEMHPAADHEHRAAWALVPCVLVHSTLPSGAASFRPCLLHGSAVGTRDLPDTCDEGPAPLATLTRQLRCAPAVAVGPSFLPRRRSAGGFPPAPGCCGRITARVVVAVRGTSFRAAGGPGRLPVSGPEMERQGTVAGDTQRAQPRFLIRTFSAALLARRGPCDRLRLYAGTSFIDVVLEIVQ
jgi:hypothetical protein